MKKCCMLWAVAVLVIFQSPMVFSQTKTIKVNESVKGTLNYENVDIEKGSVLRATSRKSEVVFKGKNIFRGSYAGAAFGARVMMAISNGELIFDGKYDAARSGGDKGFFHVGKDAKLYFGKHAQLNQQMKSMIMARPIFMKGQGPTSVIEFDPEFNADHMGWPDLEKMTNNGFSVLYVDNARMITHATKSLPSVHKLSGNGNHTHHGVLVFVGDQAIWDVTTKVQEYDGVLAFNGKTIVNTEKDLIFKGHFFEDSHCYFGSWGGKNGKHELIKTGPGKLVILGTQLYGAPFVTRVKAGEVQYRTQTAHPGHYVKTEHAGRDWAQLELIVENEGKVTLNPPMGLPTGLRSLEIAGEVKLGEGPLKIQDHLTMKQGGSFSLPAVMVRSKKKGTSMPLRVDVKGTLNLAGTIRVTGLSAKGSYLLMKADKITGRATWEVPRGMKVEINEGEVRLVSE